MNAAVCKAAGVSEKTGAFTAGTIETLAAMFTRCERVETVMEYVQYCAEEA